LATQGGIDLRFISPQAEAAGPPTWN